MEAKDKDFTPEILLKMLKDSGALLEGHFLLASGLHSSHYVQCALLLRYPSYADYTGRYLAKKISDLGLKPDFIVSPALGGIIIGHEVARHLNVPFIFCERVNGVMTLKRFPHPGEKSFIVVEDVITTGNSTLEVGKLLEKDGAIWIQSACIINRSNKRHCLAHEPISLLELNFPVYDPSECPLCKNGIKLIKPGTKQSQK